MYLYPVLTTDRTSEYTDNSVVKHKTALRRYRRHFAMLKRHSINPETLCASLIPAYNTDFNYKKLLLQKIGLSGVSVDTVNSVMGPKEFRRFVLLNSENSEIYTPGTRPEGSEGIADSHNMENVKNKKFGANLHIHTAASDGALGVQELLNQAAEYADVYAMENNRPFVIAITDHNTVEGSKEAVKIIAQNPKKYKNLKVILGAEISAKEDAIYGYKFKKPEKFHVLTMCIDPYNKQLNDFLEDINMGHKNPMNPRTVRVQEVVDMLSSQPNAYLSYAHPAYPDMKHRIVMPEDDYIKLNQDCVKFFKEKAGKKALYAEVYYGGYNDSLALDKKLLSAIKIAVERCGLLKAGGLDTHGNSIFHNGQRIIKKFIR